MQESPAQIATTIETAAVNPQQRQGFEVMDPETLRSVCSQGGRTAHALGQAHRFSAEKASQAGKKGGAMVRADRFHMAESGKPHDAKPRQSKHRSLDTARLTPLA